MIREENEIRSGMTNFQKSKERGWSRMSDAKVKKLLHAVDLVKRQDEAETELVTLAARFMQAGYELGRAERAEAQAKEEQSA